MAERQVVINNESGLHLRPAAEFVKTAARFQAEVIVVKGDKAVNGKSILHVQALGARQGEVITIKAIGADAEEAVAALVQLVEDKPGEGH